MQLVRAKNFTTVPADKPRKIDLVVIHTMEAPEHAATAENVAAYFAGANAPQASVHYCIDSDSIVQTLEERHVAWGAPGANNNGIHLEHAGYARQTAADWADDYSMAMLQRSAELVAEICARHAIPLRWVDADGLVAGERGLTTHDAVSKAFKKSNHWDPGPSFPFDAYLELVRSFGPAPRPVAPNTEEWVRVGDYLVAPRPIAPVSLEEAEKLAAEHGCELPTPALVDAIWRAADLQLAPITRTTPNGTMEEMSDPELVADQAARIEAQIAGRPFRLLAGTHKDVIRSPGGRVGLYGWHRLDGSPIQGPYFLHKPYWKDYSQGCRLVRRVDREEPVTAPELPSHVEEAPDAGDDAVPWEDVKKDLGLGEPVLEDDGGASRRRATLEAATEISQEEARRRDDE